MTAPEPTAERHIGHLAQQIALSRAWALRSPHAIARMVYDLTDPAGHAALAASLPAEVKIASLTDAEMLAALVDRGTLTAEDAPIARHGGHEHTHWQQRWDGQHTHEGRRFVTPWEVAE